MREGKKENGEEKKKYKKENSEDEQESMIGKIRGRCSEKKATKGSENIKHTDYRWKDEERRKTPK